MNLVTVLCGASLKIMFLRVKQFDVYAMNKKHYYDNILCMKKENKEWLRNKNVLIVGASSGIGKHLAFNLILKYDCKVFGISNNKKQMEGFYKKLDEFQPNFKFYVFDATREEAWKDFVLMLEAENIKIDVLINCVGELPKFGGFNEYTQKDITRAMNANFYSAIFSIRHILPMLKEGESPAIINISCLSSIMAIGGTSIYSASKSALKSYTEVLSAEVDDNFYVGLVLLGVIKTDFYKNQEETVIKKLLNRAMKPNDASNKIIKNLAKKKKRIVVGIDAYAFDSISRAFPTKSISWAKKWLQRKNLQLIKERNKREASE